MRAEEEIWKDAVGYEGRYQVSSRGQVRSLTYRGYARRTPKILKQAPDSRDGYMMVNLHNDIGAKTHKVHQLVAVMFIGPRPPGAYCLHRDGDYLHNSESNVYWGTPAQNQADRARHGTSNVGAQNPMAKLTESAVVQIKALLKVETGRGSLTRIAADFGVSVATVSDIKRGKTWRTV